MSPLLSVESIFRLITLVIGCGAAWRLHHAGLHQRYRILFTYLLFNVAQLSVTWATRFAPKPRMTYAWVWVCTEPLLWLLYVLLVLELYTLALQNYKGLQTAGRWALYSALVLALLISGMTMVPSWRSPTERVPVVFYYAMIERGVVFSLVVFIVLILFFLSWYPIKLSRNIAAHCVICTVYFLAGAMGFLVRNIKGDAVMRAVNVVLLVTSALCWLAWLTLLSPKGEAVKVTFRREWKAEDEERLVAQLTAINSSLLRATRK